MSDFKEHSFQKLLREQLGERLIKRSGWTIYLIIFLVSLLSQTFVTSVVGMSGASGFWTGLMITALVLTPVYYGKGRAELYHDQLRRNMFIKDNDTFLTYVSSPFYDPRHDVVAGEVVRKVDERNAS